MGALERSSPPRWLLSVVAAAALVCCAVLAAYIAIDKLGVEIRLGKGSTKLIAIVPLVNVFFSLCADKYEGVPPLPPPSQDEVGPPRDRRHFEDPSYSRLGIFSRAAVAADAGPCAEVAM